MYLKKNNNSVRLGSLDWSRTCHPVVSAFCVLRLQVCTTTPGKTVSTLGLNIWTPQSQQAEMHPGEQWDKHATRAPLHPRYSGSTDLGCSRQSHSGHSPQAPLYWHESGLWAHVGGLGITLCLSLRVPLTSTSSLHWSLLERSLPLSTTHSKGKPTKRHRLHSSTLYFRSQNHDRSSRPSF